MREFMAWRMGEGSDVTHFGVGKRAGSCIVFFFLISDMLDYWSMGWFECVPIPFCLDCVMMSPSLVVVTSSFGPPLPAFFVLSVDRCRRREEARRGEFLPGMLVPCVWVNLLWWRYFLYQKENCGFLGGLTFYRTSYLWKWKSEKRKKKKIPFLAQGMYKHNCVQSSPLLWALFLQLHNFFLVRAFERPLLLGCPSRGGLYCVR